MTVENEDAQRYFDATHAMQSAVAAKMHFDTTDLEAKHIRVGINSAMVDSSALAALLIAKGVITEEEYAKTIADGMEAEVERYKEWFTKRGMTGFTFA